MNQILPQLKKSHVLKDAVFLTIVLRGMWQNHVNALLGLIVLKYSTLHAYSRGKIKSEVPVHVIIRSHTRRVLFQDSIFIGCHTLPLV
jgi:hypothetical protein